MNTNDEILKLILQKVEEIEISNLNLERKVDIILNNTKYCENFDEKVENILNNTKYCQNFDEKVENFDEKVENIYKNTKRMDDHITFVESTYDSIKTPFHYLMDKVNLLTLNPFKKITK